MDVMEFFNSIWVFFFTNILARPQLFIGFIVLLGYALMGKSKTDVFIGFIKAVVGYMILQVGASGLVGNFGSILKGLSQKFQIDAIVIDPNFGFIAANNALTDFGASASATMLTLFIAFLWNIFLVAFKRVSKVRTLFITGHIMVKQATVATWIIYLFFPELRGTVGIISTALLIGTYWSVFSNLTVEATEHLTDNSGFAVGHQQMLGIWIAHHFGPKLGDKEQNFDNITFPSFLSVLNNYVAATSIMMFLFFGVLLFVLGPELMTQIDPRAKGVYFPIYVFEKCVLFTVNLEILRLGIRMFVAEMIESFSGISNKLLKGSLPAVDCAATFAFASPNAVLAGFILGAVGQIIAIAGLFITQSPVFIIPGFVPLFFDNATIGVYANKRGGIRATVILCVLSGLTQVLGSAFAVTLFALNKYGGWVGNLDWATVWPVIGVVLKLFSVPGLVVVIVLMLIIPQIQYHYNKESYFKS